ncbi:natterin-3-like [Ambystoma mexicanum]|uniref:natterin-3-like n=1 Tax=Ambystoma mexicanum TaxID=8296 RepID=UPI0037E88333
MSLQLLWTKTQCGLTQTDSDSRLRTTLHTMKILAVSFLVFLLHGAQYADSAAVPSNDPKESQEKASNAVPAASVHEETVKLADQAADSSRHNVDPQEHKEERKAELVEKAEAPWSARQLIFNDYQNLKWELWTGSLPTGAVAIQNTYAKRVDYICAESACSTGYYTASRGAFCFYSSGGREYYTPHFYILTNKDDFELLQWLKGSYGSFPENSIGRCSGTAIFVGKNDYGLGKVIPQEKVLLLPYNGYEYRYDCYEVLSLYTNYHTQKISNIGYYLHQAAYESAGIQTLATAKVLNNVCQAMKKVVTISRTTTIEQNWAIDRPTKWDVPTLLTSRIPTFSGTSVSFSPEEILEWSEGVSQVKTVTHLRNVEIVVPPNHSCEVVLQGREMKSTIPFQAQLSRFYHNFAERTTSIHGTFTNVQTEEVTVIVNTCQRLPNAPPCRSV